MKFTNRLKASYHVLTGKAAVGAPVSAQMPPPPRRQGLFGAGMQDVELTPVQAWLMYKQIAPVAKIIDLIAEKVASLGINVKVNGEIAEDHEVSDFLRSPGYNRTRAQFIRELAQQTLATGTGYLVSYGSPHDMPQAMDVLHTRDRNIITDYSDGWPAAVRFHEEGRHLQFDRAAGRDPRYFAGKYTELLTVFEAGGDARGTGLSKLNAVRTDVEMRLLGMEHNKSLLANGARLSGILTFEDSLTPEQALAAQEQFRMMGSGVENAGRVAVMAGGKSNFSSLLMNTRDMDYAALVKMVEDSAAARFGVPATLYSVDAQTYDNLSTSWHMLFDNAVIPLFDVIYTQLARHFSYRLKQNIEIEHDQLSSMVLADKAVERAAKLHSDQLVTKNEARKLVGYEPIAGGDVMLDVPGMMPAYEDMYVDQITEYTNNQREIEGRPAKSLRLVSGDDS